MSERSPLEASAEPVERASLPDHPQRRFPRIQLATTVRLRFASAEAVQECRTVDISEGGVFIRMDRPRPEGTAIRLQLHVGARDLEIGGVVVRCIRPEEGPPTGIGVLFTEIRPEDHHFVQQLVRERLSSETAGPGAAEQTTPRR
ncbi:MAG: PilZ domain-containing protein [Myxococcales bacterium]|nr:PilZ domain-containing protein [Myxococcales bacterium]